MFSPNVWKDNELDYDELFKNLIDKLPKLHDVKIKFHHSSNQPQKVFPNLTKTNVIISSTSRSIMDDIRWIRCHNITNLTVSMNSRNFVLVQFPKLENIYSYLAEVVNYNLQSLTFDNSCMYSKNGVSHTNLEQVAKACPGLKYFKTRAGICKPTRRKKDNMYLALNIWSELEHLDFSLSDMLKYAKGAAKAVSKMKKLRVLKVNVDGRAIKFDIYIVRKITQRLSFAV